MFWFGYFQALKAYLHFVKPANCFLRLNACPSPLGVSERMLKLSDATFRSSTN